MQHRFLADSTASREFLPRTLVVIPALNEAACVAATVQRWLELGVGGVRVVDNGSTDDTAAIARAAGAEVLREPRRGYGAAAWRGLQQWPTDREWVLFSSADGSDRLSKSDLPAWEATAASGARLIVGDRVTAADSRAQLKFTQRFGNWITCQAIRWGWGVRFRDMGSLRLIRHAVLMDLGLQDRGFGWNVEMQVRALERGWRVIEIPVTYYPRHAGDSKISGSFIGTWRAGRGIVRMLGLLAWMRWSARHRHGRETDLRPAVSVALESHVPPDVVTRGSDRTS